IMFDPAPAQIRPGERIGNRAILRNDADLPRSIDKNTIACEQFVAFIKARNKFIEKLFELRDEILGKIANLSADARVGGSKTRASQQFEKIIKFFALGESVEKNRHRAQVEGHCADTQQMR